MEGQIKSSQDLGQKVEDVATGLAIAWRTRNWLRILTTCFGFWIILFNPPVLNGVITGFSLIALPSWYNWAWAIVGVLLFIGAFVVALQATPKRVVVPVAVGQNAIKGLVPFEAEDASVFAKLQREDDLRECLNIITAKTFRFGILHGESGCGKTSFLQAGLRPRLNVDESRFRCVYVEFTDRDPLSSVRQALTEQLVLTEPLPMEADLTRLLQTASGTGKPLVLLFDQFEQFFFQRHQSLDTDPFVQALIGWYASRHESNHRILLSIRRDFYYQTSDLQKLMGYSLGPQELLILTKFTPRQATAIFQVMAEEVGLVFDEEFIEEVAERQLADREEGRVSPVEVQILAWLLAGQRTTGEAAFDRKTYQRLGGVEGLLERFIRKVLEARNSQIDLKVLLALTNLENNVRAGVLPHGVIRERTSNALTEAEILESLDYLSRPDVRLVIREAQGCKLAHERLIPALRKVANQLLTDQAKANQLLDRRVNEWLANDRSNRYLLPWGEWRLIWTQKPYLVWGPQQIVKEELLMQTARRWHTRFGIGIFILFGAAAGYGWLQTTWGQVWQMERTLGPLNKSGSQESKVWVVQTLAATGKPAEALSATDSLSDSYKARVLPDIATSFAQLKDTTQARTTMAKALSSINGLIPGNKTQALTTIAQGFAQLKDTVGLTQVLLATKQFTNDYYVDDYKARVLPTIATGFAQLKYSAGLTQVLTVANGLKDDAEAQVLPSIATGFAQLKNNRQAKIIMAQAMSITNRLNLSDGAEQARILRVIAQGFVQLEDIAGLNQILLSPVTISLDEYNRSRVLSTIAKGLAKLKDTKNAKINLTQSLSFTNRLIIPQIGYNRDSVLIDVAEGYIELKDREGLIQVLKDTMFLNSHTGTIDNVMLTIIRGFTKLEDHEGLRLALESTTKMYNQKLPALTNIAQGFAQLKDTAGLNQTLYTIKKVIRFNPENVLVLPTIAQGFAQLKNNRQAQSIMDTLLLQISSDMRNDYKASMLPEMVKAFAQLNDRAGLNRTKSLVHSLSSDNIVLPNIAQVFAQLGDWREANFIINKIKLDKNKAEALYRVLVIWYTQNDPKRQKKLLETAKYK